MKTLPFLLMAGLLAVAAAWSAPAALAAAPAAGAAAPDFSLRSLDGRNLRLKEQRGQVVLINFWATWCGPCREEMPLLDKLHAKYKDLGFTLLGVNVDDDPQAARSLAGKLGVHFPVLLDTDKQVSRLYDLNSMPSTVLVDKDGKVRFLHRGYRAGYEQAYEQQIRELLKE